MDDSSSEVARIVSGCSSSCPANLAAASSAIGKNPFMSQVPRPYSRSSDSVSAKGSRLHRESSHGTVSVCPESTRPEGGASASDGVPSVAIRLALPGSAGSGSTSTAKPRSSSQPARWWTTRRLLWSRAASAQLTDGSPTSVRNISRVSGSAMAARFGKVGGRAILSRIPTPVHGRASGTCRRGRRFDKLPSSPVGDGQERAP